MHKNAVDINHYFRNPKMKTTANTNQINDRNFGFLSRKKQRER